MTFGFFTVHEKFQEDYEEITEFIYVLAERLIQIGGVPVSTHRNIYSSRRPEVSYYKRRDVRILGKDYKYLVQELKGAIEVAGEQDDFVTEDIFIVLYFN